MFGLVGILETEENEEPKGIVRNIKCFCHRRLSSRIAMDQLIKTWTDSQLISYS